MYSPNPSKRRRPSAPLEFHDEQYPININNNNNNNNNDQEQHRQQGLLPRLPDHLAQLCLTNLPAPLLYSVSCSWRRLLYSPSFPPFLSLYALVSSPSLDLYSFDPLSATWQALPPPPTRSPLIHHPSFLARPFPIQSLSTSRRLFLVSASSPRLHPALSCPLVFDPSTSSWLQGPRFPNPRRWCVSAASSSSIFLFSGIGADYNPDVARSAERWDLANSPNSRDPNASWKRLTPLKGPQFCREHVDGVVARGRVYMVNARGRCAREGAVYDVAGDRWEEMPPGMLKGWTGPAAAAADTGGGAVYMVGEEEGVLWEYQWEGDTWREVVKSDDLKGAVQVAAGGGRVCATTAGGAAVVDVGARRVWRVEPPEGKQILAVHVMPRVSGVVS